jgi:methylase of polypeptide subunit release factors
MQKFVVMDGLTIILNDDVPIPGIDTATLALASDTIICNDGLVIGCGAGLLALRLAQRHIPVVAVDISESATRLCRRNLHVNGLENYVEVQNVNIRDPEVVMERCDLVVCNPPQLPKLEEGEAAQESWISLANDGGPDGRVFIDWLVGNASRFLRPNGYLLFSHFDFLDTSITIDALECEGFRCVERAAVTKPLGVLSSERLPRVGYKESSYTVKIIQARLSR